ncbi:MAG: hypothetical protein GY861_02000 [bacterium]|nr:hypothetical protein [bacterium]
MFPFIEILLYLSPAEQKLLCDCNALPTRDKDYCFDPVCVANGLNKARSGLIQKICKRFESAGNEIGTAFGCFNGLLDNSEKKLGVPTATGTGKSSTTTPPTTKGSPGPSLRILTTNPSKAAKPASSPAKGSSNTVKTEKLKKIKENLTKSNKQVDEGMGLKNRATTKFLKSCFESIAKKWKIWTAPITIMSNYFF